MLNPGGWLHDQAAHLVTALATHTARTCRHIGTAPGIVHAATWAPDHLTCTTCLGALAPKPLQDTGCDRCGQHTRRLHAGVAGFGPLLLAYALCSTCLPAAGLPPPPMTGTDS
jgi:hypothetical protein